MLAHLQATIDALSSVSQVDLDHALELLLACHNRGGIVYICGNGGSAATASHFACDLQKAAGVRAIALTDNMPLVTAWANDVNYKESFMGQLRRMFVYDKDLLVVLSCSGTSDNVVRVLEAVETDGPMVAILGQVGRLFDNWSMWDDRALICVTSSDYGVIENVHLAICHALTVGLREVLTTKPT